ncbi:unnamed protein product, partial [Owenia fusiformis]
RCGMIYIEPLQLGPMVLVKSYMDHNLPSCITEEQKDTLRMLIEWQLMPCINYSTKYLKHFVKPHAMHMTQSFLSLLGLLMLEVKALGAEEDEDEDFIEEDEEGEEEEPKVVLSDSKIIEERTVMIISHFFFALVWSTAGTVDGPSRIKFDDFYRTLCEMEGEKSKYPKPPELKFARNLLIPKKGLVFDYVFMRKQYGSWYTWESQIEKIDIDDKCKFLQNKRYEDVFEAKKWRDYDLRVLV